MIDLEEVVAKIILKSVKFESEEKTAKILPKILLEIWNEITTLFLLSLRLGVRTD